MAEPKPSTLTEKEKLEQNQKGEAVKTMDVTQGHPNSGTAPSQSTASDWDMNKSKPSGSVHNDKDQVPVGGQHNQQNPQLNRGK